MNLSPPETRPSRLRSPLLTGAAVAGAVLLLHVRDPHQGGSYGYCPFLLLTGHPCPACGGLRAVNLLTNGDVVGAMSSNLLVVIGVPLGIWFWARWTLAVARGEPAPTIEVSRNGWLVALAVVLIFWIARLTPWGAWLAP